MVKYNKDFKKTSGRARTSRGPSLRPKARPPRRQKARVPRIPLLDPAGTAYARLLNDPCHAQLAEPIYMATGTGYLTRATVDLTHSEDSGVLFVTPFNVGSGALGSVGVATSASAGAALGAPTYQSGPGAVFLSGVAQSARPVAACISTYYAGTESLRSGSLSQIQTDGRQAILILSSVGTPDSVGPLFPTEVRTPGTSIETKWSPGALDGDWSDPSSNYWTGGHGAIGVLWRSLGGQAVKFRVTIVYEWKPLAAEGIQAEPARGNRSGNTVDQVVGYLASKDPMWGMSQPGQSMTTVGGDLISAFGRLALPIARDFALGAATGLLAL